MDVEATRKMKRKKVTFRRLVVLAGWFHPSLGGSNRSSIAKLLKRITQ